MSQQVIAQKHADYGIDAPGFVFLCVSAGVAGIVVGVVLYGALKPLQSMIATLSLNVGVGSASLGLVLAGLMVWGSKVGKLRERDRLINSIAWRGDEAVLDVGCGRGLLLIAAAKWLTTGKAIGIDIWSGHQSGNRPEATWANAEAEGVTDRIDVRDGDARQLPFGEGTFDVVVSSLVLHNIHNQAERKKAVREMVRVLKPGGRIAILDVLRTGEYAQVLRESGMNDVARSEPRLLFFHPARVVTARKPGRVG